MPTAINGKLLLLILAPLMLLVTIGGIAGWMDSLAYRADARTRQSSDALRTSDELLTALLDAQTGLRGYVLTNDGGFKESFERAKATLGARSASLTGLTDNVIRERRELASVENLARRSLALSDDYVALVDRGERLQAQRAVAQGREKAGLDDFRAALGRYQTTQSERYAGAAARTGALMRRSLALRILGTLATVVIGLALFAFLSASVARRLRQLTHDVRTLLDGDPLPASGKAGFDEISRVETSLRTWFDEHAQHRQKLAEAGALQRAILDDTDQAVITTALDGTITSFNAGAERILGYAAAQVIGQRTPDDFLIDDVNTTGDLNRSRKFTRARDGAPDTVWVRADCSHVSVATRVSPLRDDRERTFGYLSVSRDLTAQLKADDERQTGDLERSSLVDRMRNENVRLVEALGTLSLAREVSEREDLARAEAIERTADDVRTNLSGLVAQTRELRGSDWDFDREQRLERFKQAEAELSRALERLPDRMKSSPSRVALENIPFDLVTLIDGAVATVRSKAAAKSIERSIDVASNAPDWVLGDPTRLRNVLLQLLNNALETASGPIGVLAERTDTSSSIRFMVSDAGAGVSAEHEGLLLREFSRLDDLSNEELDATGLALAICNRLVREMGGTLAVTSGATEGRVFTFTLALPTVIAQTPVTSSENGSPQSSKALRILIADDDKINGIIVEKLLKRDGHSVDLVSNGAEAVEAVKGGDFDLVLMDMQMPVMNGVDATRHIRRLSKPVRSVPVIALTANVMAYEIALCVDAGMDGHLAKPVDRESLRKVISARTV